MFAGKRVNLQKTHRYLFVVPELGRVGWVRVMKTRITKAGDRINWTEPMVVAGHTYKPNFEAIWGDGAGNVRVDLSPGEISITGFFSVAGFEILSIEGTDENAVERLQRNHERVSADLTKQTGVPPARETGVIVISHAALEAA